ncbi:hypothetical protein B0H16DRAFT_1778352 [Mycena metata]|uniref:Uncharacterized protein n=1 Tax=Mycena metata TaxID=1033252 RepID=A0AAD7MQP3_9AGAR|nr:hypothetical protein B0H16DRAFT_1778352 [Mycena metata]
MWSKGLTPSELQIILRGHLLKKAISRDVCRGWMGPTLQSLLAGPQGVLVSGHDSKAKLIRDKSERKNKDGSEEVTPTRWKSQDRETQGFEKHIQGECQIGVSQGCCNGCEQRRDPALAALRRLSNGDTTSRQCLREGLESEARGCRWTVSARAGGGKSMRVWVPNFVLALRVSSRQRLQASASSEVCVKLSGPGFGKRLFPSGRGGGYLMKLSRRAASFSHGTRRGPTGGAGTKKIGKMVLRRPQFALREVTTALIFKTRVR